MVARVPPKPQARGNTPSRSAPAKAPAAAPQRGITGKPTGGTPRNQPAPQPAAAAPTPAPVAQVHAPAPAPYVPVTLAQIVQETLNGQGFLFVVPDAPEINEFLAQGFVETNSEIQDDTLTKIACRATDAGINAVQNQQPVKQGWAAKPEQKPNVITENVDFGAPHAASAPHNRPAVRINKPEGGFSIAAGVPMPNRSVSIREQKYPFDELQNGHSFFVPATDEVPDPAKSMAGTVSSANKRHSRVIPGQTKIGRGGKTVEVRQQDRQFTSRRVADGEPWGYPGIAGCAVYRVL